MTPGGKSIAAALLLTVSGAPAVADPICADRPGNASATCTAPAGHWQLETGVADWTRDDGSSSWSFGATAIKYGLTDRAHVEVDVTPYAHSGGHGGIGDTLVRIKQRLTGDDAALQVSLYPYVKLPTARHALGNGKVEAGLALPIGFAIPNSKVSVALTPELDWAADGDAHGRHAAMAQVVSLGWQVTDKLSLSAELWGQWDWDPAGTQRQASADGAVAYLARDDLQLDAGANFGLNRATPDVQVYVGLAKRF